jgi:hypothetical protein
MEHFRRNKRIEDGSDLQQGAKWRMLYTCCAPSIIAPAYVVAVLSPASLASTMSTNDPNEVLALIHTQSSQFRQQHSSLSNQPILYRDCIRTTTIDNTLTESTAILTLLKSIASLVPHSGPLADVLGVTLALIGVVKLMRDNQDDCNYLIERILQLFKNLLEELKRTNIRAENGTPTAVRVYQLVECVVVVWSWTKYLMSTVWSPT